MLKNEVAECTLAASGDSKIEPAARDIGAERPCEIGAGYDENPWAKTVKILGTRY